MQVRIPNAWLWGIGAALILSAATIVWVPVREHLVIRAYYYASIFDQLRPRVFAGTISYLLELSPQGFIWLIQFFKFLWLAVLCAHFFSWLNSKYLAFALSAMFAFTAPVFIDNALGGHINAAGDFWLIAAAACLFAYQKNPRNLWLISIGFCAAMAIITHEKNIFPVAVILLWAALKLKPRHTALLYGGLLLLLAIYFYAVWDKATFGFTPARYLAGIKSHPLQLFFNTAFTWYGVLTSIGFLWVIYGLCSYYIISAQKTLRLRIAYSAFCFLAVLLHFGGLLVAIDSQRMLATVWVAIFLMIGDQAERFNKMKISSDFYWVWGTAVFLQLTVPPTFIFGHQTVPLNCYAKDVFVAMKDKSCPLCLRHTPVHRGNVECHIHCGRGKNSCDYAF